MIRHQTLQDKLEYYKVKDYSRTLEETLKAWKELQGAYLPVRGGLA
jgi:hypothetical protein